MQYNNMKVLEGFFALCYIKMGRESFFSYREILPMGHFILPAFSCVIICYSSCDIIFGGGYAECGKVPKIFWLILSSLQRICNT